MFDTNFNSIDSRHSDLDDGTEATLIDATSEADQASKGVHHSRSSTPQSHKDSCPGPGQSHGQGCPVYSCGCYNYGKIFNLNHSSPDLERLTDLLPNRRENLLPLRNDYPEDVDELQPCLKRKRSQYESDDVSMPIFIFQIMRLPSYGGSAKSRTGQYQWEESIMET